ncbi:MAG: SDR family NAD(P)-dependent oxidoreductase [Desulfobacteraceae bacterium]|nr:SDR family NAD(P)-dependent oxidoreductase [Desulfobacteraceae bacterium]
MSALHKNFFITGSASGIGCEVTESLLNDGHKVFATDIDIAKLETEYRKRKWPSNRVSIHKLDVRNYSEWDDVFSKAVSSLGSIDVALNISGIMRASWIHETPQEDIQSQIDVNIKGVIFGTKIASRHMIKQKKGHIINIASMAGMLPVPGMSVYCCSKYAVIGFSKSVARELKQHGVFITVVCPDAVDTPIFNFPNMYDEQAAMAFAGPAFLDAGHVSQIIIQKVLKQKPEMVCIPKYRGMLAKIGELFPGITKLFLPLMIKRGKNAQQSIQKQI